MHSIDLLIAEVLRKEGGYVNHPADKGGPTNFGITQATLSMYLGRKASIQEVKSMYRITAANIYKKFYYFKPGIDRLPEVVQPKVFDIAVNSGPSRGIKILQEALQGMGYKIGLAGVDGRLGSDPQKGTLKASIDAATANPSRLINEMVKCRERFYRGIVKKDPSQKVFLDGWLARNESFRVDDTMTAKL